MPRRGMYGEGDQLSACWRRLHLLLLHLLLHLLLLLLLLPLLLLLLQLLLLLLLLLLRGTQSACWGG